MSPLHTLLPILCDFLSLKEIARVWLSLCCPILEKEIVYLLCERMRIKYNPKMNERLLFDKMSTTRRCYQCGIPTSSVVRVTPYAMRYMCTPCCGPLLISRSQMRLLIQDSSKVVKRRVVRGFMQHPFTIHLAKRSRNRGAFLYWREDFEKQLQI